MAKRPGKLKQLVEIYKVNLSTDSLGGQAEGVPTLLGTEYADVRIDRGSRGLEYEQAMNNQPYIVDMRDNPAIVLNANSNFFIWEGKRLTINSVEVDPDRKMYQSIKATFKVV